MKAEQPKRKEVLKSFLEKFDISTLNPMQTEARKAIYAGNDVAVLSPTGSGKTLAFLLPIIERLDPNISWRQRVNLLVAITS